MPGATLTDARSTMPTLTHIYEGGANALSADLENPANLDSRTQDVKVTNATIPTNQGKGKSKKRALEEDTGFQFSPYTFPLMNQVKADSASPFYSFSQNPQKDSHVWMRIPQRTPAPNEDISTNICLAPTGSAWTLEQVKVVAKAILYFEPAIDALISTQGNIDRCQNIRNNAYGTAHGYKTQLAAIDSAVSFDEIIFYMNSTGPASEYPNFRWDFAGLGRGGNGMITFRQPRGFKDEETTTRFWVMVTACFVRAAFTYERDSPDGLYEEYVLSDVAPSLGKDSYLREFVEKGARLLGYREAVVKGMMRSMDNFC
ncbi:hypothetical protein M011DRAFT_460519 [Sporormia fimetaria CBS 119925]|uniref:Uncharacterized protein n=1 Tax=Sporormia fimetaria CBS 119925 TaxID=1340428 RepID=A0A6A6V381_9PLEO|nr:hypothetical protein M011DRAFT_460519 [Sporormia fimetaria CBS 119925]